MRLFRSSLLALTALAGFALPSFAQNEVTPFADTSRLVAIGGSLLEIVYALGEEGKLVARDTTGVYPPEAMALPDVGYMRALSPEGVLAVNPSALLVVEGSGPPEALDVLAKGSIPYVTVPDSFSHEGVLTKVRTVGKALGVEDKAEVLAAELDAQMQAAEAATKDIPAAERQKVLFVISVQDGKIRAAGTGTAANGIITLAGAVNPLAEMHGYQTLSDEAILTANPDVVLFMNNGGDTEFEAKLKANPALAATPAMTNGRIMQIDGGFLLGFGPRTPAAILELAGQLYGDKVAQH
jgi:iron complex transport system substrate-binding protein